MHYLKVYCSLSKYLGISQIVFCLFNSLEVKEHTLYDFSPLKFIETFFAAEHMSILVKYMCTWIYTLVLLNIVLLECQWGWGVWWCDHFFRVLGDFSLRIISVAERGTFKAPAPPAGFSLSLPVSVPWKLKLCVHWGACALGGGGWGLFLVQSPLSTRQYSSASPVILIFSKPALSDKYNLYSFFFWTICVLYSKYVSCRQHITA